MLNPNRLIVGSSSVEAIGVLGFFASVGSQNFLIALVFLGVIASGFCLTVYYSLMFKKRSVLIFAIVMLAMIPMIESLVTGENSPLLWDPEGMHNVAQTIFSTGHIPTDPSNSAYVPLYVEYPGSFALLAMMSQLTGIPVSLEMIYPTLTSAMLVVLSWIITDGAMKARTSLMSKCIAVAIASFGVLMMNSLLGVFLYQNFGIMMLFLLAYLLLGETISQNGSLRKKMVLLALLAVSLTMANPDVNVDLGVIIVGVFVGLMARGWRQEARGRHILSPVLMIVPIIIGMQVVFNYAGTQQLSNPLLALANEFFQPSQSFGLARYKLTYYTTPEVTLLMISAISIALLTIRKIAHVLERFVRTRRMNELPISLSVLIVSTLLSLAVILATPYGFTLSSKVIPLASIAMFLFFLEESRGDERRASKTRNYSRMLTFVTLALLVASLPGFFVLGGYSSYSSQINHVEEQYTSVISRSGIVPLFGSGQTITVLDSPLFPGFFTYSYIAHRVTENWQIFLTQPLNIPYNYRLLNGLPYPRLYPVFYPPVLTLSPVVIGGVSVVNTTIADKGIVFNSGYFEIGLS